MSVTLFTTQTAWQWGKVGEGEGEEVPWLEAAVFVVAVVVALVTI